jgi:RNA polymerase sigma-70 factor (ECF subfamily)
MMGATNMLALLLIIDTGDRVTVERYYKDLKSEMRYVAFCILKDSSEAETAVQEAFIRIMSHMDRFNQVPNEKKPGYCFAVVRNVSLNMSRKASNMQIILSQMDDYAVDMDNNPDSALIREEEFALLRNKLDELDPDYKIPLVLRFADTMRYRDIAVLLDISEATAKKRVERGIDRLVTAFRKEGALDA